MRTLGWIAEDMFAVWVKPRAKRNQIVGLRESALHVSLTAPPVEGKANEALVGLLAELLGVRRKQIEIVSGLHSRHKVIRVADIDTAELRRRVEELLR